MITKTDVARRHTEAAIRMLFSGEDPLAVATVSHAADEVLTSLTKKLPGSFSAFFTGRIQRGREKTFWDMYRRLPNFLKHSSANAHESLEVPGVKYSDGILAACALMYRDLTTETTPTMEVYLQWFAILNPQVLAGGNLSKLANSDLGLTARSWDRESQLELGRNLLRTKCGA